MGTARKSREKFLDVLKKQPLVGTECKSREICGKSRRRWAQYASHKRNLWMCWKKQALVGGHGTQVTCSYLYEVTGINCDPAHY